MSTLKDCFLAAFAAAVAAATGRDSNFPLTAAEELAFCEESIKFWYDEANGWQNILRKRNPNGAIPAGYCEHMVHQAIQRAAEWELEAVRWRRTK